MKLTFNNYFDTAGKLPFSKMPDALAQSHDMVVKATDNGKNWNKVSSNETLKRVTTLYLEKLSAFLMANPEYLPTEKPVKSSKPKAPKAPKVSKPKAATKVAKPTSSKPRKTVKAEKPVKTKKAEKNPTKSANEDHKPAVVVRKKSLELQIVTRLLNLNGKTVKKTSLEALLRMINKAEAENKFMHGSKGIIEYVNDQLKDAISKLGNETAKFNLKSETVEKLQKVIDGAKFRLCVDYLAGTKAKRKVKKRALPRKKKVRSK